MDRETIVQFARETLGCSCPDEVFEQISVSHNLPFDIDTRILIGERLLIYLVTTESHPTTERLKQLATIGSMDRDRHAYNRLRVVCVGDWAATAEPLDQIWSDVVEGDEKSHLHCLESCSLLALS